MRIQYKKWIISIIGVFMIVLIAHTPTITVADIDWGNLNVGDEMHWNLSPPSPMVLYPEVYYEMTVLEIRAEDLKVDHRKIGVQYDGTTDTFIDEETYLDSSELWPWIYPTSLLQEDENIQTKTYEYEGTNYKAAYLDEIDPDGRHYEYWWDYDTGILFQRTYLWDDSGHINGKLMYTDADLTERRGFFGGLCLSTILIALIPVTTLFTYSFVQYKKKKNV